ncbi:MAG: TonB-dependent receptor plug domain-containing protein [Gemmatimonadales bacterium]
MSRLFVVLPLLAAALPLPSAAQQTRDSVRLRELVVTATRETTPARLRATAADAFGAGELGRRQVAGLTDALRLLPGAAMVGTGGTGGATSTFFRGVNSNQTLILVDGIRVNDANALSQSFLGGFEFLPGDRLEVARGPQSTAFGGAALGGVIAVSAAPAAGNRLVAGSEAGSFATIRGRAFGSVRAHRLGVSLGVAFADTDNERPDNQFDQRTEQLRVDYAASGRVAVGLTFRGMQHGLTSPGDIRTSNSTPVGHTRFDNELATVFADVQASSRWTSRITFGLQDYFLEGRSRFDGSDEFVSRLGTTRRVADWQHRVAVTDAVSLTGGVNAEWATVRDPDGERDENLRAGYLQALVTPTASLLLTAGARYDHYSTFGGRTTGRVAAGYFVLAAALKLRATVGTGFMPPSLAARFGSAFQAANAEIRPESSTGFDVGVDRFFAAGRAVASVTYFWNEITDLIGFESAPYPDLGRSVNIAEARTEGVEAAARAELGALDARVSYTLLSATDLSAADPAERRLIRRPRQALAADLNLDRGRLLVGVGAVAAFDREDTDFNVFPFVRVNPGDYVDARLYGEWRLGGGVAVRGRIDNLFNERYEEAYGFPALGRRITIGLRVDNLR